VVWRCAVTSVFECWYYPQLESWPSQPSKVSSYREVRPEPQTQYTRYQYAGSVAFGCVMGKGYSGYCELGLSAATWRSPLTRREVAAIVYRPGTTRFHRRRRHHVFQWRRFTTIGAMTVMIGASVVRLNLRNAPAEIGQVGYVSSTRSCIFLRSPRFLT